MAILLIGDAMVSYSDWLIMVHPILMYLDKFQQF